MFENDLITTDFYYKATDSHNYYPSNKEVCTSEFSLFVGYTTLFDVPSPTGQLLRINGADIILALRKLNTVHLQAHSKFIQLLQLRRGVELNETRNSSFENVSAVPRF